MIALIPLLRKNGELVEVSWDEALDIIVSEMTRIKEKYGPIVTPEQLMKQ